MSASKSSPAKKAKQSAHSQHLFVGFRASAQIPQIIETFGFSTTLKELDFKPPKQRTEKDKQPEKVDFKHTVTNYTKSIESIQNGLELIGMFRLALQSATLREARELCEKKGKPLTTEIKRASIFQLPIQEAGKFFQSIDPFRNLHDFFSLLPQLSLVGMVSNYDSFLGNLIGQIFRSKPEIIEASEKTMTYKKIVEIGGIDNAAEYIISKEIESVLRESHLEQFRWLEKKLGIPLTDGLDCFPSFIEACERRNLFAHADGIVSEQYVKNCTAVGYRLAKEIAAGSRLKISTKYLSEVSDIFHEIGLKLAHVAWRKVRTEEKDDCDTSLNQMSYELIRRSKFKIAQRLLEFSVEMKYVKDFTRRMMTVNLANAYKLDGNEEKACQILDKTDWSASGYEFRISVAAIRGDFDHAAELMRTIGKKGAVEREDYHEWPVFHSFRKSEQFRTSYKSIFKTDFELDEIKLEKEESATTA